MLSSPPLSPFTNVLGSLLTPWMTSWSRCGLAPQYLSLWVRTTICFELLMLVLFSCQGPPELSPGRPSAIGQPAAISVQISAWVGLSMRCAGNSGLLFVANRPFQSAKGGDRVTVTVLLLSAPLTDWIWS